MFKFIKNKLLPCCLCLTLLLGIIFPNYVKGSDVITIDVRTSPQIDISVTTNETIVNMDNFKTDILTQLENNGIDTSLVNIETIERNEISSNSSDAATIFNNWTQFPYNRSNGWYYDSNLKAIRNNTNPAFDTGFIDTQTGYVKNINLSSSIYGPQYAQPLGYIFGAYPQANNSDRYNMYMLWVSGNTSTSQRVIALFKVEGLLLDYNDWKNNTMNNSYTAIPLSQWKSGSTNYWGWIADGTAWYNFGGYPHATSVANGVTATNIVDKNLKTTSLGWINVGTPYTTFNLELDVKGDNFKVYYNNGLVLDITDEDYEEGYYGLFQTSHVDPRFYGIDVETSNAQSFKDILLQPSWREDADHYIINVDDIVDENFTNTSSVGEILTRTINDDITFIQWGTDDNKSIMENFISQNNDNGTFIDNTNYTLAVQQTAKYIADQYETISSEEQLVVVNDPVELDVNPESLATNTKNEEYPNGKWIIHHDAKYYANGTGQSEYAEAFQDDLSITFDKPGKYTIYYEEDLIKTVYAHRLPIANFDIKLNDDNSLSLANNSYDLDSNNDTYGYGNGIVNIKWQWKNINDTSWSNGIPNGILENGETYIVQLSVQDEQGAWSSPTSKYITLDKTISVPPVASFSYGTTTIFTNNDLEILDSSYDPTGISITEYQWVLKKDKTTIATYTTQTPNLSFSSLGTGTYSYTLKVKNSDGLWSDGYTKSFTVIEDTIAPSVMIDPTYSDWGDNSTIHFEFSDNGSGFLKFRYAYDTNQTQPSDTSSSWSEWSTKDNGSLTIEEDGVWYLHIQALDNNNNKLIRTVGVYRIDNTKPVLTKVTTSTSDIARTSTITVIANDVTSGLKKDAYRFVNKETGEDSGYISSNVYNAKSNGTFTIYVKDQNNNEVSTTIEIENIDRDAPYIIDFQTSTKDWTKELSTIISIEDDYAGVGEKSYAIEKLNNTNEINPIATMDIDISENSNIIEISEVDVDNIDLSYLQWQDENEFSINENGTYKLYARDVINNVTAITFSINNIDRVVPTIERMDKSTIELTNQDVVVTIVNAMDNEVGLNENPYSFDNGKTWTNKNTYSISENGTYKILVRDALGNTYEETYTIENIDKILPIVATLETITEENRQFATLNFKIEDDTQLYGYALTTSSTIPNDDAFVLASNETSIAMNGTYKVTHSGIYYLYVKDMAGNVYSQRIVVSTLVTGIDFTQEKVTEYQEVTEESDYDTMVYATQHSTFGVIIPKTIILDGQSGIGNFQTSVVGNIAGVETVEVKAPETFLLKDSDNIKNSIVATVTQDKYSYDWRDIVTKTTSNGSIVAKDITAGKWNGMFYFNISLGNNQNTINSIGSIREDNFALVVEDDAIQIPK